MSASVQVRGEIEAALKAHGAWRSRLVESARSGVLPAPVPEIRAPDLCRFGVWLNGAIQRDAALRGDPEVKRVRELHAAFHLSAGQVAELIERGDREGAERELRFGAFHGRSRELRKALIAWYVRA